MSHSDTKENYGRAPFSGGDGSGVRSNAAERTNARLAIVRWTQQMPTKELKMVQKIKIDNNDKQQDHKP